MVPPPLKPEEAAICVLEGAAATCMLEDGAAARVLKDAAFCVLNCGAPGSHHHRVRRTPG
jgi:hypothetical protein